MPSSDPAKRRASSSVSVESALQVRPPMNKQTQRIRKAMTSPAVWRSPVAWSNPARLSTTVATCPELRDVSGGRNGYVTAGRPLAALRVSAHRAGGREARRRAERAADRRRGVPVGDARDLA